MSHQPDNAVLEQVRQTLAAHDPDVRVEVADESGSVRVHSSLDEGTVLKLLRSAALPLAAADEPVRSDCCGGCCGG
jgi:hypothetical protein